MFVSEEGLDCSRVGRKRGLTPGTHYRRRSSKVVGVGVGLVEPVILCCMIGSRGEMLTCCGWESSTIGARLCCALEQRAAALRASNNRSVI
jgi:hypothetical protein